MGELGELRFRSRSRGEHGGGAVHELERRKEVERSGQLVFRGEGSEERWRLTDPNKLRQFLSPAVGIDAAFERGDESASSNESKRSATTTGASCPSSIRKR